MGITIRKVIGVVCGCVFLLSSLKVASREYSPGREKNKSMLLIEGHFIENDSPSLVDINLSAAHVSQNQTFYTGRLKITELSRDIQRILIDATLDLIIMPTFGLLCVADTKTGRKRLFNLLHQSETMLLFQSAEFTETNTIRILTYSFTQQDSTLILFAIEERLCSFDLTECQPPLARYYILKKQ